MAVSQLYLKDSYTNQNIDFLISNYIREYDMSKANISILLSLGLITKDQYDYYLSLGEDRSIAVGILQRDNDEIRRGLKHGFVEYRKKFFEANDVHDEDVLSIKKDAIYLIDKQPRYTSFDYVNFVCKNEYTSYYKCFRYEMYYGYNRITDAEKLDIKGMSKSLHLHDDHMSELLKCAFECAETDIQSAIGILSTFLDNYMNFNVEREFYREFNDVSEFKVRRTGFARYSFNEFNTDPRILDISYNRKLIEMILSYYTTILLNKLRV